MSNVTVETLKQKLLEKMTSELDDVINCSMASVEAASRAYSVLHHLSRPSALDGAAVLKETP